MRTVLEAETQLAACELTRSIVVTDVISDGEPLRRFAWNNPNGAGESIVEHDRDPTTAQLDHLVNNLPVLERDREAARTVILGGREAAPAPARVRD